MKKQYAVIGMGTFGTALAETLAAHGQEVLAIDLKHQKVQELADRLEQFKPTPEPQKP